MPFVNGVQPSTTARTGGSASTFVIILLTVQVVISRTVMGLVRANRRRTRAAAVADDEDTILD